MGEDRWLCSRWSRLSSSFREREFFRQRWCAVTATRSPSPTGSASFEMCTKIKIFWKENVVFSAVLFFPFFYCQMMVQSIFFKLRESTTAQHSLRFALVNCRMVIFLEFSFYFLVLVQERQKCVGSIWILLRFLSLFVFVKSPKN